MLYLQSQPKRFKFLKMSKFSLTFVAICAGLAAAETHYLFSGFFNGTSIAALEFDDAKSSLDLVKNITINANSSKWISIDVILFYATFACIILMRLHRRAKRIYMWQPPVTFRAIVSRQGLGLITRAMLACPQIVCRNLRRHWNVILVYKCVDFPH